MELNLSEVAPERGVKADESERVEVILGERLFGADLERSAERLSQARAKMPVKPA